MASDDTIKIGMYLAAGGLFLVGKGISDFRKKRRIADVACSKTATAAQGLCEFEGFAWHAGTIFKNISDTDTCARFIELQQYVRRNKSSHWDTVWTHSDSNFFLIDKTGAVQIHIADSKFDGVKITKNWGQVPAKYQSEIQNLLPSGSISGFPPTGWFGGSYRIVENSIPVGCPVYCQGNFSSPTGLPKTVASEGVGAFFSLIQKQAAKPVHTLRSLDTNRDGIVSEAEAQSAFIAAGQVALRKSITTSANDTAPPLHGMVTSSNDHPMILAARHQHYLLQKVGKWCLIEIVGGAALVAAAAFVFLAKFGSGNY